MNQKKLLLFDVDGTLISSEDFLSSYEPQLSNALSDYFNEQIKIDFSGLHGGTEIKNLKILMERQGLKASNEELQSFFKKFGRNYQASREDLRLLPYVSEVISRLSGSYLLGLVTGNQEWVARKRLDCVELNHYFHFGTFGNESDEREDLVTNALEKAKEYGWNGDLSDVYVIGDTPKDIAAGKSVRVNTIAVATGSYTQKQLQDSNSDYVINNLSELEEILNN